MRNNVWRIPVALGILLVLCSALWSVNNLLEDQRGGQSAREAVDYLADIIPTPAPAATAAPSQKLPAAVIVVPAQPALDHILYPEMEMPTVEYEGYEYLGILEFPSEELQIPVIAYTQERALRVAPCRYSGSVYSGDMVIGGHNYATHFRCLSRLKEGTEILFTDVEGNVFRYCAALHEVLPETAVEEMKDTDWPLTLFTCTTGGGSRYTLRCTALE